MNDADLPSPWHPQQFSDPVLPHLLSRAQGHPYVSLNRFKADSLVFSLGHSEEGIIWTHGNQGVLMHPGRLFANWPYCNLLCKDYTQVYQP